MFMQMHHMAGTRLFDWRTTIQLMMLGDDGRVWQLFDLDVPDYGVLYDSGGIKKNDSAAREMMLAREQPRRRECLATQGCHYLVLSNEHCKVQLIYMAADVSSNYEVDGDVESKYPQMKDMWGRMLQFRVWYRIYPL